MKKLIFSQVVVSFVSLAVFFLIWKLTGDPVFVVAGAAAAFAVAFVATSAFSFATSAFVFVFAFDEFRGKRAQAMGIMILLQFATLYGIMAGSVVGFGAWWVVIPTAAMFALALALFAPMVIKAIARLQLVKEERELKRTIFVLEREHTYRFAPLDYDKLQNRLAEVNERLAKLNA